MRPRPKFFTNLKPKQTMEDQTQAEEVHLDLDKPEEAQVQVADEGPVDPATFAEATTAPAEEGQDEAAQAETEEKKTELEPEIKPGFNCQPCKGLGLKDENTVCPECQGTGKVG